MSDIPGFDGTPLTANDLVAPFEVAKMLGCPLDDLLGLATGPFALNEHGMLSIRVAFGLQTFAWLGQQRLLGDVLALKVACAAATGAQIGGGRSLLVSWDRTKVHCEWFEGEPTSPPRDPSGALYDRLRMPFFVIPADRMIADLALIIGLVREQSKTPAH